MKELSLKEEMSRIKSLINSLSCGKTAINEYYEPRLPFTDDNGEIDWSLQKNPAEIFLDWLEDFGKYGKLPPSKMTMRDGIKSVLSKASDMCNKSPEETLRALEDDGLTTQSDINDRGQLFVERAITLYDDFEEYEDIEKMYKKLISNYQNNVGGCWAWKDSNPYCGGIGSCIITLKGYIRMEDIDWLETVYHCVKYDEHEIRVKPNAKVELFDIYVDFNGGEKNHLKLRGPLIVTSTYFGNRTGYQGEYASIYDTHAEKDMVVNRKGEIMDYNIALEKTMEQAQNGDFSVFDLVANIPNTNYAIVRLKSFDHYRNVLDKTSNSLLFIDWFDNIYDVDGGNYFVVTNKDNKENVLDIHGNYLSSLWFDEIQYANYNYFIVRNKDNGDYVYNILDFQGNLLFSRWYREIYPVSEKSFWVRIDKRIYLIDKQGNLISNKGFDEVKRLDNYSSDIFIVRLNNKENLADKQGNVLFYKWFDKISLWEDNFIEVTLNGKRNIINKPKKFLANKWFNYIINRPKFLVNRWFDEELLTSNQNVFEIKADNEWNLIDSSAHLLFDNWYANRFDFKSAAYKQFGIKLICQ